MARRLYIAASVFFGLLTVTEALAATTVDQRHEPTRESDLARLGRTLFFDRELSLDRTISCVSCHQPDHGWSSPKRFARGVGDCAGKRHVPSLYNVGLRQLLFWDGRESTLEKTAMAPIEDACEMSQGVDSLIDRLQQLPRYR